MDDKLSLQWWVFDFIASRNFARNVAMAVLYFYMCNDKLKSNLSPTVLYQKTLRLWIIPMFSVFFLFCGDLEILSETNQQAKSKRYWQLFCSISVYLCRISPIIRKPTFKLRRRFSEKRDNKLSIAIATSVERKQNLLRRVLRVQVNCSFGFEHQLLWASNKYRC